MSEHSKAAEMRALAAEVPGTVLLERAALPGKPGLIRLFRSPERILVAHTAEDVRALPAALERALADGLHVAGYFAYEAGFALEPALGDLLPSNMTEPLAWFACVRAPELCQVEWRREDSSPRPTHGEHASMEPAMLPQLSLTPDQYAGQVGIVRNWIAEGQTYQANLTMEAAWSTQESAPQLYDRLLGAQPVPYAALLHPEAGIHILSLSPEMFFRREGRHIVTRPMKGTAPRGVDAAEDGALAAWLKADEKNRSENVMIVDLLRNDLGRICEAGSVTVPRLFEVEQYPSVLQMTSTIEGLLRPGVGYTEIFRALFPSGSIVGAPKIHTARLLHGLEKRTRGVYTGAIGYCSPANEAEFNVAIRTVTLQHGQARMGVGSGIVYDSEAGSEYDECRTKTLFLTQTAPASSSPREKFKLIETLLWQRGDFLLLRRHMERMAASAEFFRIPFAPAKAQRALDTAVAGCTGRLRVRLLLTQNGTFRTSRAPLERCERQSVSLLLADKRTDAADPWLRHKSTHRRLYDEAFARAQVDGYADALFCNSAGELTECAIHNLLVRRGGRWLTPPVRSGVLPGVLRGWLLDRGCVVEQSLSLHDLQDADALVVCNSVRGLRRVDRIVNERGEVLWPGTASGPIAR